MANKNSTAKKLDLSALKKFNFAKLKRFKGVQIVSKAVPNKTTMSILECILVDCTQGFIKVV